MLKHWATQRLQIVAPKLLRLGRYTKRAILVAVDLAILSSALWLAFALRLGEFFVPATWELFFVLCAAPLIGVATCFQLGLYRMVTRYIGRPGRHADPAGRRTLDPVLGVNRAAYRRRYWCRARGHAYPILATASIWGTRRIAGWLLAHAGVEIPSGRWAWRATC